MLIVMLMQLAIAEQSCDVTTINYLWLHWHSSRRGHTFFCKQQGTANLLRTSAAGALQQLPQQRHCADPITRGCHQA
jgi:hypothetical protein